MENDTKDIHQEHQEKLARLDAMVETAVISEVDIFSQLNEREVILIRFLNNEAFALYEPKLFEELGSSSIHGNFITRTKKLLSALEEGKSLWLSWTQNFMRLGWGSTTLMIAENFALPGPINRPGD